MDSNGLSVERYPMCISVRLSDKPYSTFPSTFSSPKIRELSTVKRHSPNHIHHWTKWPNAASQWPLPPSTCFSFTFYATIWILFFLVLWLSCTQQHQPRSPISFSIQFRYRFWSLWEIFRSIPTSEYYLTRSKNKAIRSFRWFLIPLRNLQKYSYFRILSHEIKQHGNTSVCWTGTISCLSRSRSLPEIFRSIPTSEYYLLRLISCVLTKSWQQHL